MTLVLAIDPGTTESAYVEYGEYGTVYKYGKMPNKELLKELRDWIHEADHLAIEMVACYGMAVGAEIFQSVLWAGRFIEAAQLPFTLVYRQEVKLHLCRSARANDSNIRQAIIDRYGGKDKAVGKKKSPGPLYGISKDVWSALAIAICWSETKQTEPSHA